MIENKRFTVYGKEIVQGDECWAVAYSEYNADVIAAALNKLAEENEQYKKKSISLKQLYKILEENKEHYLSLSECFSEKLLIKTIFRSIDDDIESMEEEE